MMSEIFEKLNKHNSTVIEVNAGLLYGAKHNGEIAELRTTQDPVVSDDGSTYSAPAVDVFDYTYNVTWEVINTETTDESEACDWDTPIRIEMI